MLRDWWPRAHLSAMAAISPVGTRYCRSQDHALASTAGGAFLEHLRREVSGRMVRIGEGAPIPRRHLMQECLAKGAAPRLHLARLPAYAPELNPGEGLWGHRQGGERRHVCGLEIPHWPQERRDAVKRVRRNPRIIQGGFRGAKLEMFM
jgi:transposase